MNKKFHGIYRDLYRSYQVQERAPAKMKSPFETKDLSLERLAASIVDEVSEAKKGPGRRLRSDARLFLLVNIHQLLLLPVSHPVAETENADSLLEGLRGDVRKLVRASDKRRRESGSKRIKINHLMSATVDQWAKLSSQRWRVWG